MKVFVNATQFKGMFNANKSALEKKSILKKELLFSISGIIGSLLVQICLNILL